jgi:hypothetical protein
MEGWNGTIFAVLFVLELWSFAYPVRGKLATSLIRRFWVSTISTTRVMLLPMQLTKQDLEHGQLSILSEALVYMGWMNLENQCRAYWLNPEEEQQNEQLEEDIYMPYDPDISHEFVIQHQLNTPPRFT